MNTSSYMIERVPLKYGGHQEDYEKRVCLLKQWGAKEIKAAPQNESDLVLLFFRMLEKFTTERKTMALEHKTPRAEKFATRRDIEGTAEFYHTILADEYSEYNGIYLTYLAENMRDMNLDKMPDLDLDKKKSVNKYKIIKDSTCLGRSSSFEIELFEGDELSKKQWLAQVKGNDFPSDFPKQLLEKARNNFTSKDFNQNRLAYKNIKNNHFELYKRIKMSLTFMEVQKEFPTPQKIPLDNKGTCQFIGKEGNLKSFFVMGTARLTVNGKNYATTQCLTWLYRDFQTNPIDRMLKYSTVILIHQDNFLIDDTLKEIALLFAKAVITNRENLQEIKNNTALVRYYMANNMAWERGSCSIAELFEGSIYGSFDLEIKYQSNKQIDLEALTKPLLSPFITNYDSMIELTKDT